MLIQNVSSEQAQIYEYYLCGQNMQQAEATSIVENSSNLILNIQSRRLS
ncbi:MAG TPA: hypothetical protein VKN82_09125 [Desulfohalobiaceae bacterium]|nr:hypothetical protein [Desulfohalobiaceae bacterium]